MEGCDEVPLVFWSLVFIWSLVLGVWIFPFRASSRQHAAQVA
jgi:hypothetical protein